MKLRVPEKTPSRHWAAAVKLEQEPGPQMREQGPAHSWPAQKQGAQGTLKGQWSPEEPQDSCQSAQGAGTGHWAAG